MNMPVLFSIIVPTYNRAHLISQTIESILKQTYTNFELIIVDDGSNDNTEEVVQGYLSARLYYYKKTNSERAAARNFGTNKAKGDYINWIDSDDIVSPDHLAGAVRMIEKYHRPEIFTMGFLYELSSGRVSHLSNFSVDVRQDMYKGNQFAMSALMVRKDIALLNPFNEDRSLSASEDYELWLRLAARYIIYTSEERTVSYILHDERSTVNMNDPGQLIIRYQKFIDYSLSDARILVLLGTHKNVFIMKNFLILAVDLIINNHRKSGLKYICKAFSYSPQVLFERGFYAFIKYYIRHAFS
jgi:glycosyltransferase involved in cell wall biosynthesis